MTYGDNDWLACLLNCLRCLAECSRAGNYYVPATFLLQRPSSLPPSLPPLKSRSFARQQAMQSHPSAPHSSIHPSTRKQPWIHSGRVEEVTTASCTLVIKVICICILGWSNGQLFQWQPLAATSLIRTDPLFLAWPQLVSRSVGRSVCREPSHFGFATRAAGNSTSYTAQRTAPCSPPASSVCTRTRGGGIEGDRQQRFPLPDVPAGRPRPDETRCRPLRRVRAFVGWS